MKKDVQMTDFGLSTVKREGAPVVVDPGALRGRRKGVGNDWMEIPVPKNASRARVHKMVDEWLDERANGFRRSR